jgi:opine dehydrogenase
VAVRLYEHPDLADGFAPLRASRTIEIRELTRPPRTARLATATHDLDEAIAGASIVNLVVPVSAQSHFVEPLLPRLSVAQTAVFWAGRFGGLRMARQRAAQPGAASFGIVEANTLPYGTRRTGPTEVTIGFRALRIYAAPVGTVPATALATLRAWFPILEPLDSPVDAALRNSGTIILGVGAILNAGAIESAGGRFALFRDGMTGSVRRAVRAVHLEIVALGRAMGFDVAPYPESVYAAPTSIEGANFRDAEGGVEGFHRLTGPDRLFHRYTVENIRFGLAVAAALGARSGVPMPATRAIVDLADATLGSDFARLGWSLAELGLE